MKTKKSCLLKSKCKQIVSKPKSKNKSKLSKSFNKSRINKMSKKSKKSLSKSLVKSHCNKTNKIKKVNFNIVLDLDNTIISSLTKEEYDKRKIDNNLKFTSICNGLYYTLPRPYLEDFLNYIFARFHVSVWTAASKDYAKEIIEKFVLRRKKNRKLRGFLYDIHCKESMNAINPKTMKDLRYLYISKNKMFNENNTVIIDDLKEVLNNNKKNSIDSEYFDSSKKNAPNDTFLLKLMNDLEPVYQKLCSKTP
jgi:TFIIF-interacting CTD phosphatase-like protein